MDRKRLSDALRQAQSHVAAGEAHLRHQQAIIAELENDGHDATLAREILATIEKTQALHVEARDQLIKELSQGR
jgi:hypothetical protein